MYSMYCCMHARAPLLYLNVKIAHSMGKLLVNCETLQFECRAQLTAGNGQVRRNHSPLLYP